MHRKIVVIVAALIVPGGFIALFASILMRSLARTERGRKMVEAARSRVPVWTAALRAPVFGARQAA